MRHMCAAGVKDYKVTASNLGGTYKKGAAPGCQTASCGLYTNEVQLSSSDMKHGYCLTNHSGHYYYHLLAHVLAACALCQSPSLPFCSSVFYVQYVLGTSYILAAHGVHSLSPRSADEH